MRNFLAALAALVILLRLASATEPAALAADSAAASAPMEVPATGAAPAAATVPVLLDSLVAWPDSATAIVNALIASGDAGLSELFLNITRGNVYTLEEGGDTLLLIAGAEETIEDETWVPLFRAYPYEALKDGTGAPRKAKLDELTELETGREVRLLIQPVLTLLELRSAVPAKRRAAAATLAEAGDTLASATLKGALDAEGDPSTRHFIAEAWGRLELRSADPARRKAAALALGDAHAGNALPELKALITADASGAFPEKDESVRAEVDRAVSRIEAWNSYASVLQNLFSGLSLGSILILMALGLAIIFGLMGVINMAHGEFMMIGAYTTFIIQNAFRAYLPEAQFGYFLVVSLPFSFLVAGLFGMLVETTIIRRLYGRPLETLLATWGISLLLVQAARHQFGDLTAVSSPVLLSQGWEIVQGVVLPYNRIFIILLTAVTVAGMAVLFYRTRLGTTIRAVTQNRGMSSCLGIATRRVDMLTFGLGTGMAGLAGCALTQIGNVDPGMGQNYIVDSFLVVVTGGVGKLAGTIISGLSIGGLNKFLEPFLQSVYAKVALLGLVILFLQRRPSGLFPAKGRHED